MTAAVICFLLLCILPAVMTACGVWFLKSPPEVNGMVGYKSAMSQKNADTWFTAHRICGRLWVRLGAAAFAVCIQFTVFCAVYGLYREGDIFYLSLMAAEGIQLVLLLSVLPLTERRLKKIFTPDGRRR